MSVRPTDEQAKAIKAIVEWYGEENRDEFYLAGYAGVGKSQPLTSIIQTPLGPTSMGSIQVGQDVLGADGKPVTVVAIHPQGVRPVYRVTFRDKTFCDCSLDHLWKAISKKDKFRTVTTQAMIQAGVRFPTSGDAKFRVPLCAPVEYDSEPTPADPYVVGALLGDGYIKNNIVSVIIATHEQEIIERIRNGLPNHFKAVATSPGSGCTRYTLIDTLVHNGNRLKDHLQHQQIRIGSRDKFIPFQYLYASIGDRTALLHGLMDTDGTVRDNRTTFCTSSPRLATDIATLVQSLGGIAIRHEMTRPGKDGSEFHVNIKTRFNPFFLSRKALAWRPSTKNPPSRYITSIDYIGEAEQQCITIANPDGLYLTDNFIVTHNSTLARIAIEEMKERYGIKTVRTAAYTGKAASVLRKKGNPEAQTIHSLIYTPVTDEETGEVRFVLSEASPITSADLVVLDECSMLDDGLANDLRSFGKKILVMGDPGQLPPINGQGAFTRNEPDVFLHEIHRQAADSPILELATMARKGERLPLGYSKGGVEVLALTKSSQELIYREGTQPICGLNRVRCVYTQRIRSRLGYSGPKPIPGERVMCCRNNRLAGIFNGGMGRLESIADDHYRGRPIYSVTAYMEDLDAVAKDLPTDPYLFANHFADGRAEKIKNPKPMLNEYDWSYIITAHKAQGSSWDHVTVVDDGAAFRENQHRWRYTALTRAETGLTVLLRD